MADPTYLIDFGAGVPHSARPNMVAGLCGHAVALSEWRAGLLHCERCTPTTSALIDLLPALRPLEVGAGESVGTELHRLIDNLAERLGLADEGDIEVFVDLARGEVSVVDGADEDLVLGRGVVTRVDRWNEAAVVDAARALVYAHRDAPSENPAHTERELDELIRLVRVRDGELPAEPASVPDGLHVGRAFSGNAVEQGCSCALAPCGLVDASRTDPACLDHPTSRARTMRQIHRASQCPGGAR
ncbi:hypothetical protein O7627_24210 [Solwaraspora sp. WMMD1047]|uniref:hypothetical protein n=1 Tax=Solwaraspora sp. WMMD1047 TaxID=3016102 RepID=UPI002417774A|nr:hypothetical protein [Solwaraspora sp. WMMD1047]MDG4832387.1 hypothetical protein [Solwaraspora sp. WMMD1047]